jgi:hypothetical protein
VIVARKPDIVAIVRRELPAANYGLLDSMAPNNFKSYRRVKNLYASQLLVRMRLDFFRGIHRRRFTADGCPK